MAIETMQIGPGGGCECGGEYGEHAPGCRYTPLAPFNINTELDQIKARLDALEPPRAEKGEAVPVIGDKATCRACDKAIHYTGQYWTHSDSRPRHLAVPADDPQPEPFDAKVWAKRMVRMSSMPCYEGVLKLFDHKSVWCHGDFKHAGQSAMNAARGAIEKALTAAREPLVREVERLKEKLLYAQFELDSTRKRDEAAEARVKELEARVSDREAELLRVRTTGHGAAHAIDNIAVEAGLEDKSPTAVAAYVRRLRKELIAAEKQAELRRLALDEADSKLCDCANTMPSGSVCSWCKSITDARLRLNPARPAPAETREKLAERLCEVARAVAPVGDKLWPELSSTNPNRFVWFADAVLAMGRGGAGWRDAEKEKPQAHADVLLATTSGGITLGFWSGAWWFAIERPLNGAITHFMALPTPPGVGGKL